MRRFMTPLRWKIALGYFAAFVVTYVLRHELESGWSVFMTFLAPLFTFLSALIALKFGVVITALGSFIIVFLQGLLGLIIAVSKIGIIKGLFLPWLMTGLHWLHRKSEFLQKWVAKIYEKGKKLAQRLYQWWSEKSLIDKILLAGFLGPLIFVVVFAVLLKRFVYLFISKKAAEQLVQKATKATVSNFHKIPVVGKAPTTVKEKVLELKQSRDTKLSRAREKTKHV